LTESTAARHKRVSPALREFVVTAAGEAAAILPHGFGMPAKHRSERVHHAQNTIGSLRRDLRASSTNHTERRRTQTHSVLRPDSQRHPRRLRRSRRGRPPKSWNASRGQSRGRSPGVKPAACTRTITSFSAACGWDISANESPPIAAARSCAMIARTALSRRAGARSGGADDRGRRSPPFRAW
jgi:hypothetical protein